MVYHNLYCLLGSYRSWSQGGRAICDLSTHFPASSCGNYINNGEANPSASTYSHCCLLLSRLDDNNCTNLCEVRLPLVRDARIVLGIYDILFCFCIFMDIVSNCSQD